MFQKCVDLAVFAVIVASTVSFQFANGKHNVYDTVQPDVIMLKKIVVY